MSQAPPRMADLLQPMLASPGKGDPPAGDDWVFEPKYDGIRIVAVATADAVALVSRNGIDKCRQFPEITDGLRALARKADRHLVLDGEIVALNAAGAPARFQDLQGRMHLLDAEAVGDRSTTTPTAFVAFDLLLDGADLLVERVWNDRRARLERVVAEAPAAAKRVLRPSTVVYGSADSLMREAHEHRWEGIMAKRRDCPYEPGRRVRHWRKLKIENQQELVIGGWTEPRNSRKHFGALLLGYYDDDGQLVYAGHTGTGFSDRLLDEVFRKLRAIEQPRSPFSTSPKTNERAHWTAPTYVAQIRFNEWTAGGNLRQPVFLGLRDDKNPRDVRREARDASIGKRDADELRAPDNRAVAARERAHPKKKAAKAPAKRTATKDASRSTHPASRGASRSTRPASRRAAPATLPASRVVEQLRVAPAAKHATLQIDRKTTLELTNLGKLFYPEAKITKGRLMEYYAEIAPVLLPALDDRPLVLKRYPNGIRGEAFYQQKAPDAVPDGVRVEEVTDDGITTQRRLIGGNLATLLYLIQLGAISTDPWHSRVQHIAQADYSIIDLDPGPKATFKRVIQVARWVKEELDEFGLHAVPKTSGASGIHIVLPLPRGASYDVSVALAELVARRVNQKHPKETTVHRWVKTRPAAAVYVDYLQNIRGKTVASVYSARAEPHASVSTPLKWSEITDDLHPTDFTIQNVPARLTRVGDLWAQGMRKANRLPGVVGDAAA